MPSHFRADLNANGALFHYASDAEIAVENAVAEFLAGLKDRLWLKPHALQTIHSRRYVNQMFDGDRPMPIAFAVQCLFAIQRLGDRREKGQGREWVRRILDALARPFGLEVVPARTEAPTKGKDTEVAEASIAVARTFVTFDLVTADGVVTRDEEHQVTECVRNAQAELDDLTELVRIAIKPTP